MTGTRHGRPTRHAAGPVTALLVTTLALAAVLTAAAAPVSAQRGPTEEGPEPLRITAVSPWVAPDGVFQVRMTPAAGLPLDARLTWTVHQRLATGRERSLRQRVDDVLDGGQVGRVVQAPVTTPLSALGDATRGLAVDVPLRSTKDGTDRLRLTEPGQYPVELVLLDPDGPELWRRTVLLNRLPEATPTAADGGRLQVAATLLLPVDSPPTLGEGGSVRFSAAARSRLEHAAGLLDRSPSVPFTTAVRANTVDGLVLARAAWSDRVVGRLGAATSAARPVGLPYVRIDTAGLVAEDAQNLVRQQVDLGRRKVRATTGRPVEGTTWVLDDSLDSAALTELRPSGVDAVVAMPDAVRLVGGATRSASISSALPVDGVDGARVLVADTGLGRRLTEQDRPPALRSHAVVSGLMATWFTALRRDPSQRATPAAVVPVDPSTDPAVVDALGAALSADGPVTADPSRPAVPAVGPAARGRVALVARRPTDQGATVLRHLATTGLLDSYRSMTGAADPDLPRWSDTAAELLSRQLSTSSRSVLQRAVAAEVQAKVDRIVTPADRAVTLTARAATVPLRFRNRLPFPARVLLRLRAPRLRIDGGRTRVVELAPGTNRVDVEVTSQAPGQSLLRVETRAPDGPIRLRTAEVPVRSSTISGVGAALSIVSLLFLFAWWLSASRRRRRHEARSAGRHPTADDTTVTPGG